MEEGAGEGGYCHCHMIQTDPCRWHFLLGLYTYKNGQTVQSSLNQASGQLEALYVVDATRGHRNGPFLGLHYLESAETLWLTMRSWPISCSTACTGLLLRWSEGKFSAVLYF